MVSQFVAFTTPQVLPRTSKMVNSAAFHRKGNRGSPDVWFGSEDCGVIQAGLLLQTSATPPEQRTGLLRLKFGGKSQRKN